MLDYRNIEEELDLILSTTEKELDQVYKEKETLKEIEKDILKTGSTYLKNETLNLSQIKKDLTQIENLNENMKYLKFYESLNQIENEKAYLKKLDLINKIVSFIKLKKLTKKEFRIKSN